MNRLCSFGERLTGIATIGFVVILGLIVKTIKDEALTETYINLIEQI